MLTVLSPAKRLDWAPRDVEMTAPLFQEDADRLARTAKQLSQRKLMELMDISADLAKLNADRFQAFATTKDDTRPAALAFAGDTYMGLEATSFEPEDLRFAQERVRILSGLYGVLRPLDGIQQYRLEMGSRLKTRRGGSLYDYWGDQIAKALTAEAKALGTDTLVNCASVEYFTAADRKALKLNVITPQFFEEKPTGPKIISFFAKRARGAMARYIVERRLTDPTSLLEFEVGGYAYAPELSTPEKPAFYRSADAAKAA